MNSEELVKLENLIKLETGKLDSNYANEKGIYPFFTCAPTPLKIDTYSYDKKAILLAGNNANGNFHINYYEGKFDAYQRTYIIEVKNEEILNIKFLYYYLKICLNNFKHFSQGTSTKFLTKKIINNFKIRLPPLDFQLKCINILKIIDKEITTIKKINKNLENQILALFKKCFFNFDFKDTPLEGMNIRMKSSEWGNIPETWEIKYLDDKQDCPIIKSGIDKFDHEKIYIATADVNNSTIINNNTLITMNNKPSRANMQPIKKSIWFAKMIDSRKLIMVDDKYSSILNNYIFSTGFCGLNCSNELFYYLWTFLLTDRFNNMKDILCNGTTMQAINNTNVKNISYIKPDNEILNYFNKIAKPIYDKIHLNKLENTYLTKLRDNLLPKLMSGELDVSQVEL